MQKITDFLKRKVKIGSTQIDYLSLLFYALLVLALIIFTLCILLKPNKTVYVNDNNGLKSTITIQDNIIELETNYDGSKLTSKGTIEQKENGSIALIDGEFISIYPTDNPNEVTVTFNADNKQIIFIKED